LTHLALALAHQTYPLMMLSKVVRFLKWFLPLVACGCAVTYGYAVLFSRFAFKDHQSITFVPAPVFFRSWNKSVPGQELEQTQTFLKIENETGTSAGWMEKQILLQALPLPPLSDRRLVSQSPPLPPGEEFSFILGGDLLLSHNKAADHAESSCERAVKESRSVFGRHISPLLRSADAIFANLESPLSDKPFRTVTHPSGFNKGGGFQVKGTTMKVFSGFPLRGVALANNHIKDIPFGVEDTISNLKEAGVGFAGAGMNLSEALQPLSFALRGRKIAFISASDLNSIRDKKTGWHETPEFVSFFSASSTSPGIWDLHTASFESMSQNFDEGLFQPVADHIQSIKSQHDVVILYFHFQPNIAGFSAAETFRKMARRFIDAGVDIFYGNHPHHMQEIQIYKEKIMVMGGGEMLRSYPDPSFAIMKYQTQILYRVRLRSSTSSLKFLSFDLLMVNLSPWNCSMDLVSNSSMAGVRKMVKKINPTIEFDEIDEGLTVRIISDSSSPRQGSLGGLL
jgi:poly-gamma-glutamate synthesis protein (capsule biosynthesis protein)